MANLPYTSANWLNELNYAPVLTRYPFLNAQTPDGYPQTHTRFLEYPRSSYQPRASVRTAWTNLFTRAHTPAHADWSKTNLTATDSVVANPENGLTTAARLLESSATGEHKLTRASAPTFTAANHAVDFCAKALGDRWLRLHTHDGTETYEAWFHPTSGAWKYFADVINATTLNGGFETAGSPFGAWTAVVSGSSTVTRDTGVYDSGTASCKLTIDGSDNAAVIYSAACMELGRRFRRTVRAKADAACSIYVTESIGGSATGAQQVLTLSTSWQSFSDDFISGGTSLLIDRFSAAGRQIWIDGVVLTPLEPLPVINATTLNGGFETSGSPFGAWTAVASGSSTVTRDTGVYDSGTASCKLTIDGIGNSANIYSPACMRVGRRFRRRIRAKADAACSIYLTESIGGSATGAQQVLTLSTSWQTFSDDFTAAGPSLLIDRFSATGREIWIDNVTLTPLDLPTVTMTALPWPAEGWYRCSFIAPHRAATGSWTLALSSDGTTLSYAGNTAVGAYVWGLGLYAASSLGPIVETVGSTRTVSAPDIDSSDPFAYLAAESEPQPVAGDLLRVERTFARLPATQTRRDYQTFSRPNPSGRRSSTTYAANVDGDESFRLWTARKSVLGYQNTPGGTSSNTLPSGNITITLSTGHSATFAANASQSSIQSTINANIVGVGKLASCTVATSTSIITFWLNYYVGSGVTVTGFTVPSGTTPEQTQSYLRCTAFGTTITPDTKLIHCPSHGAAAGELVALWNSHALVARGTVAAASDANYLSIVLSDLDSPDFSFSALTLGDDATVRYASGPARINVSIATDYYLPGVSMLSGGSTLSTLSDLPAVTTYTSEQRWLDRLVAAATTVPIDATQLDSYVGPITSRATVTAIMDDKILESLTLT